ncbi:MAG: type-F conjugative transfer system protein TraW [Pseudomonadota bacterium]
MRTWFCQCRLFFKGSRTLGFIVFLLLAVCDLHAKDFGVQGETFAIQERNLLHVLADRLQSIKASGQLAHINQEIGVRVKKSMERPSVVAGLRHTQESRSYRYDPTLVVQEDLQDHQGRLIAAKGTRINPLDYVAWGTPLLLIDGDDVEQVRWSQSLRDKSLRNTLVLINGRPLELSRQLDRPVYFDQGGRIVKKFGIRQVPCRISQVGKSLLVEELQPILPGGNKHDIK